MLHCRQKLGILILGTKIRYLSGSRTIDTHIYKLDCYPYDLIGPASVMWRPLPVPTVEQTSERDKGGSVNDKGKGTATAQTPQANSLRVRSLWIRFHPSVNNDMLDALKQVATQTLSEYKEQYRESEELKVEMVDRKGQMNVFEILGPKSSQILKGSLRLVATDKRKDFLQVNYLYVESLLGYDEDCSSGMHWATCKVLVLCLAG